MASFSPIEMVAEVSPFNNVAASVTEILVASAVKSAVTSENRSFFRHMKTAALPAAGRYP